MANDLYPQIEPFATHRITVDPPHEIHVEECGNPDGIPAVFFHGGPGGGAKPFQRRTFDPARFRVILFDQRGCGRSTPSAELSGNTTSALIADIETVRETLGIDKWLVTGGSWGSLLSLAYAAAHPDRCLGLRIHGVFLGTPDETRFWFHGIGRFFPEVFAEFEAHVPVDERNDLLAAYSRRLVDPEPGVHLAAAQALRRFSARTQTLLPSAAHVDALTEPRAALEIARIFTHYCSNGFFLAPGQLLDGIDKLRHLPCEIVQGRYDVVTPPRGAARVKAAWPEARLTMIDLASHVATLEAPALSTALRDATDRLADTLAAPQAPAAPAPALPTIEDFLAPRACHSPAVSDDGSQLAFVSDANGLDQLYVKDLASDAAPVLRVSLAEKVGAVAFRPKTRDILFTTDVGGDERHQLHLIGDGEMTPRALTADPGVVHAFGAFDPDGGRIAFASNKADAHDMAVHVLDLSSGHLASVLEGPGWRKPLSFSPDGKFLLVEDNAPGMFDAQLLLLNLSDGTHRVLLPRQGAHIGSTRWLDGGARLLLVTDCGKGFHGLADVDVATGTLSWIARPLGDIELLAAKTGLPHLAYAVNEEGTSRLVLQALAGGAARDLRLPFKGRATALSFVDDGAAVIVALTGFRRPSAISRIDIGSGAIEPLAEHPPLSEADTVEPQLVAIESFDGAKVPAFVFEPNDASPPSGRPALVIVHGGPESQYAAHWRSDVQYLTRRGYVVVAPNVRGSTGYGRAWQAADDREKRMDSVRDLKAVRDWLAARADVDSGRLAVFGQSYGGFMVLAAVTHYPDDWQVAAEFYGIADFNTLMATTGPWRRTLRAAEYGDPDTDEGRALLARLSPLAKAAAIKVPLFIAHGLDDPRVPPGESEMIHSALRGRGHPVEIVRIAHEGHGFARLANRRVVYAALMRFLFAHNR